MKALIEELANVNHADKVRNEGLSKLQAIAWNMVLYPQGTFIICTHKLKEVFLSDAVTYYGICFAGW